ncbi:MAG: MATE family efflux transporter [Clostridia bacterium]|nr:MATE family efflux transporter [Clostridia bacterium]
MANISKKEIFESLPVPKALAKMAIPTVISQLINLIYNMVDAFFIGRTGNSYMMAATTVALTLMMLNVAFSNLFGIGGGSLVSRLLGRGDPDGARSTSAFSCYGAIATALLYSFVIGIFSDPILRFLGASDATVGYAGRYTFFVIVLGSLPTLLSLTIAHLLRNAGYSSRASFGLSLGGLLNIALDPLFMFVIFPPGNEVVGAAVATLISNTVGLIYLLFAYGSASRTAPLSFSPRLAFKIKPDNLKQLFSVGIPSAILTALFDLASICVNILSSAHNDLVLAGMGIVMKVERIPNAVNIGLCQGMLPIVAYNYASGNRKRMNDTIRMARFFGLGVSAVCILLLEIFAGPVSGVFLSTSAGDAETAALTVSLAALYLRIRCLASPFQFINYHTSFCMQAMGKGKETLIHAAVRELVFYIPLMFLLDRLFGDAGLASALPAGEALGAVFALILFTFIVQKSLNKKKREI